MRAFFFLVFFDMAVNEQQLGTAGAGRWISSPEPVADARRGQAACTHRKQVVGAPGVDHPVDRHLAFGSPVAAVGLPLELAGGMRIGVDREVAAVVDGQVEQLGGAGRAARDGS